LLTLSLLKNDKKKFDYKFSVFGKVTLKNICITIALLLKKVTCCIMLLFMESYVLHYFCVTWAGLAIYLFIFYSIFARCNGPFTPKVKK